MKRIFVLFLSVAILFAACKSDKKENANQNATDSLSQAQTTESDSVVKFYIVPAPKDIFGFSEDKNLGFYKDLLNPIENLDKYVDSKLQEFNFGVYSADLAYAAAFNKKDEITLYLDVIKKLGDKIGLSEVFDENLINRIQNVEPSKDSLIKLSMDVYFKIIHTLEKYNKDASIAIIAAGGWVETIYLVVNQVEYSQDSPTIQELADQKYIFDNLINSLEQLKADPNVNDVLQTLLPLKEVFDNLKKVKVENNQNQENKVAVGGSERLVMSKDEFETLKQRLNDIRNTLTLNKAK